jgi:LPXTG-motif cell wall-anchored protein
MKHQTSIALKAIAGIAALAALATLIFKRKTRKNDSA